MELQEISDRMEIEILLNTYTDIIDTKNWNKMDEIFTPDAEFDYTEVGGIKGRLPEIKEWLAKALAHFPVTQHLIGKPHITFSGGDKADCKTLVHNPMVLPVDDEGKYDAKGSKTSVFFVGSWYLDSCVKADNQWRIAKKYEQLGFFFGDIAPGAPAP